MDNLRFRKLLLGYPTKAIQFLYDHHFNSLLQNATRLTHDREAAEDIVQEAFLHIWKNHKQLGQPHELSIKFYLQKIVRNKAISYFKTKMIQREKSIAYTKHQIQTATNAEVTIIKTETVVEVRKIIKSFPPRERQCLHMRLDEELSVKQMADRLKITIKAVERSLTSANKRLKRLWLARA